jgi:hypothetical protein
MAVRSRREKVFIVLATIARLYAFLLLLRGTAALVYDLKDGYTLHLAELLSETLTILFLLSTVLPLRRMRTATYLLFSEAAASFLMLFTLNRSTGEGPEITVLYTITLVGFPALLTALLFLWRTSWDKPGQSTRGCYELHARVLARLRSMRTTKASRWRPFKVVSSLS